MKRIIIDKPKKLKKDIELTINNTATKEIKDIDERKQIEIINQIYLGITLENYKKVIRELNAKIQSYKTQDKKKNKYNEETIIKREELYEKIVISKLKCFYCSNPVKIVYNYIRDDFQWTLDRIDNALGHSNENTVICCLKCNLQRRVTDAKKFEFTKKLRIVKEI